MTLTSQQQRMLFESAMTIGVPQQAQQLDESTQINMQEIEPIVMEYINNALSDQLNESASDEEIEMQVEEAVHNLNVLCALVNEYFNYNG